VFVVCWASGSSAKSAKSDRLSVSFASTQILQSKVRQKASRLDLFAVSFAYQSSGRPVFDSSLRVSVGFHLLLRLLACPILIKMTAIQWEKGMSMPAYISTVRLSGALRDFVGMNVGEDGSYENVSEYICDLSRRDKERAQALAFDRLKAELGHAFAAPDDSYQSLSAADVIERNQR